MPTIADLKQAEREAQYYLEQWNLFIENAYQHGEYVNPLERQRVLDRWTNAENKAGELRRQIGSQPCQGL